MGHTDIIPFTHQNEVYKKDSSHSQYVRMDPIFRNPSAFILQEMDQIPTAYGPPKIKGRWIYIDGTIPKTNENISMRSLSDMRSKVAHQEGEKKKKFNVICDEPMTLLTKEQQDYYSLITKELLSPIPSSNLSLLRP